jgi:hypothetical protein
MRRRSSPQRKIGRRESCGNAGAVESVENQKQVFHFPTATNPSLSKQENTAARAGFALRPAAALRAASKRQEVIVVDTEK